jgi:peptide/nickel transport system substrate-binding protein
MTRTSVAGGAERRPPGWRRRAWRAWAVAGAVSLLAAGCASGQSTSSHVTGPPIKGGTATFALPVGQDFSWLFPIENVANDEPWEFNVEDVIWRPLYFEGVGANPIINERLSLAYPPVWSGHDQTVTIRLKHYLWSDGTPVTSRDVEFFLNLERVNKTQNSFYAPGTLPDDVKSVSYPNASTIVMHLARPYSQQWFDGNQLTWIFPLPQHVWDKTSLTGKVGNYDRTTAGAKAVFTFLFDQSKEVSTYATNPLWQTMDGPWRLAGYDATTFQTTLEPNPHYSGPDKPHLAKFVIDSFPDETAEIDALRSGVLTYGYLPLSDYGLKGYLQSRGFTIAPWAPQYVESAELGFTSPVYGPLVRQLYLRQALQHLVDEPLYMTQLFHNLGQYTYGPVPNLPGSPYVSPQEKTDPYPYSISAARGLLTAHGWAPGGGGYMVCKRPGTGPTDCGAKIAAGRVLALKMMYSTGVPSLVSEVQAYQTAAKNAGVQINLDPQTETTMFSIGGVCPPGPCDWGIQLYASWFWNYGQGNVYPTSESEFTTGNYWGGGYSSPTADRLIHAAQLHTGLAYLYAEENYLSRNLPALWFPTVDNEISVVKDTLHGWLPQSVFTNPMAQDWYYTK